MMKSIVLKPTGQMMPVVGFGMWQVPKEKCKDLVVQAIKAGYRLLDCASDYGNEKEVGEGIKAAIEQGLVKREDLFVTSKLWGTNHRKENVKPALQKTLADLGLDYLDLYLIHFPIPMRHVPVEEKYPPNFVFKNDGSGTLDLDNVPYHETWGAMERMVDCGLARNIGVSNLNTLMLMDLLTYARIRPAVLQIELHPYLSRVQLVQYAQENGVAITAYSSFGDSSYTSFLTFDYRTFPSLLKNDTIASIAGQVNRTSAQVLLRWAIQRGCAVIPKSQNPERIQQNFDVFDFELTGEQMETINLMNINMRFNDPARYAKYPIFST